MSLRIPEVSRASARRTKMKFFRKIESLGEEADVFTRRPAAGCEI